MVKLSDYVMRFVARQGVKHVFFVPGGGAMHLNDSLGRCQDLEYVSNHHEQACAIAAEAWRLFSRTGVTHLMSFSGLHVTLVSGLLAWLVSARRSILAPETPMS